MAIRDQVTISDIAERANVSISTVSRVLRGTARVSDPKRKAVLAAVEELNYQPNVFARGLASGQSMAIGVLTQNFGSPFYDAISQGVIRGLENTGYSPLFADGQWQPEMERRSVETLMQRQIDGLIITGGLMPSSVLHRYAEEVPLLIVARRVPGLEERCLCLDNFRAAHEATMHLIELGHHRIVYIGGIGSHDDAVERRNGYLHALDQAGIEPDESLIVEGDFRRQAGLLAVDNLMRNGVVFTAIFAANDQMAFGARMALFRRGIRVPEDISLIGFDDEPAAAFMIPPLTTVRQPAVELGLAASKGILDLIQGKPLEPFSLKMKLIVRESVALLR